MAMFQQSVRDKKIFDKNAFISRVLGDEELAREVIEVFLDDIPNKISALTQVIKSGDISKVRDHAHAIKGAALNVSALALGAVALGIEKAGEASDMDRAVSLIPQVDKQFEIFKNELILAGLA
jgi:two-component system sensor histidine kinase/response regulator